MISMLAAPVAHAASDLPARLEALELEVKLLRERLEKLEQGGAAPQISAYEIEQQERREAAEVACQERLGPEPEFKPIKGTKVNPEYMEYLKKRRACMREQGVE